MNAIINGFKQIGNGLQQIIKPRVKPSKIITDKDALSKDWQQVGHDMQTSLHDIETQMPVDHSATNAKK